MPFASKRRLAQRASALIWALSLALAAPALASEAPFAHPYGEPPAESSSGSTDDAALPPRLPRAETEDAAEGPAPRSSGTGNPGGKGEGGTAAAGSEPGSAFPDAATEPAPRSHGPRNVSRDDGNDAAPLDDELALRDGDGRPLGSLGIAGMGTGAALAGLGGLSLLASVLVDGGGNAARVARTGGWVLVGAGGAAFTAGAVMFGLELLRPAVSPSRGGAARSAPLVGAALRLRARF